MAVIKSGDTADQLKIDTTSKAARVTLYDTNGNALSPITVDFPGVELDLDTGAGTDARGVVAIGLPAAGGAVIGGTVTNPIKVDPTGTTTQPISGSVAVSNLPATQPISGSVSIANFPSAQPITDNSGSLTIDTPQLPTGLISGRLDVNIGASSATVPISGAVSVSNLNVQQQTQPSPLAVTATGAAAAAVTATLPAAGAGLYHYITFLELTAYTTAARTGAAAPVVVTSTNLPGSLAWTFDTAAAVGVTQRMILPLTSPLKVSSANAATTIVGPATASVIWRFNVMYYTAT